MIWNYSWEIIECIKVKFKSFDNLKTYQNVRVIKMCFTLEKKRIDKNLYDRK